ncbi:dihydrolipoyl dehydrogenase [Xenorhabdus nematophila]|uniref:Dihydrolipoyl dehydrogenase n=1 Tax=Xenorhabdus nematophila (strain ATCC 19061 / DSM 3370 / CCUG 14189 / LMG 1036 / NCIMB 9965 / AN6) TaxID=406817 RepID=D3V8V5_XENNA|nr:dihydrolipoyl dehydrogenase [Xenorhabdus nematophila]CEE92295.1 dihydrolipoamide dehydrogenase, FAD/NAD(P)-binding, component of the 2-oxoglutarate dehydrogenase and the pyruvate dehydrogenase complexes [Xenorhabdus nematophila str. Anatoliense]CEF30830.1 dihydrolipoamide dehydrogenase, FAD/NAD(P)-binding, component of the 2-oxoglutarate dehydrogenase and the pyruvate dehydrogenase complexes [Xenorhabdus nematophila str. Websteri]AYA40877.1 dihydrolipoyl dehydrogenase [Xenorhabdus nematophila
MSTEIKAQVVVLGAGPAGYSAAFRCADLGLDTVLVERYSTLGGVCLNVGCIPSKALLHVAKVIEEAKALAQHGIVFGEPQTDIDKIRLWKEKVISQLTGGLGGMAKGRKVNVVNGIGKFTGANTLVVEGENGATTINFDNAIIAAGSRPIQLPFIPHEDPRVWDSTDALELKTVPGRLLVMGGGIIGLEMGTVYHALGSQIDVVEMFDQVIPAADKDIVKVFTKRVSKKFNLMLETKVTAVEAKEDGIYVTMEGKKAPAEPQRYDAVLVAIGRVPNGKSLDAGKAGVEVDERGFIHVDKQMRTNVPHIFAIGDIVGQPMLAHKGVHEGHVAAEVISGKKHYFDPKVIPSIAYTEPEVAWVGLTEKEAKEKGISYETATFPWAASGRAIASDCSDGMTKLIFDKETNRVIGGAVVGTNGGELLGEIGLAIEMGCDAEDIALTIHAHPTLYESIGMAAEIYEGSITDLPNPKAKKKK